MASVMSWVLAFRQINAKKNSFSEQNFQPKESFFLPPFLGEMGMEVLFFIPQVEPWLQNGWKIYARRPELYPKGTAFPNHELFSEIDDLMKSYQRYPVGARTTAWNYLDYNDISYISVSATPDYRQFTCNVDLDERSEKIVGEVEIYQKKLRKIIGRHILTPNRPFVFWDYELLASEEFYYFSDLFSFWGTTSMLLAQSKPFEFVHGKTVVDNHIGIQLRQYSNPDRNSDVPKMMKIATEAAKILKLPIIVYGPKIGTVHPDGYQQTYLMAQKDNRPLLALELNALRSCSLMISPESGWLDLMGWLQIPTLAEDPLNDNANFRRLSHHRPTIRTINFDQPVQDQINELFAHANQVTVLVEAKNPLPVNVPSGCSNFHLS